MGQQRTGLNIISLSIQLLLYVCCMQMHGGVTCNILVWTTACSISVCCLLVFFFVCFETGFLISLQLAKQAGQARKPQGSSCPCSYPPMTLLQKIYYYAVMFFLTWLLELRSSCLLNKHFTDWALSLSPAQILFCFVSFPVFFFPSTV